MKYKKILLLLVISLFVFVGCQKPNNPTDTPKDEYPNRIEPIEYGGDCMTELPDNYILVWADEFNYEGALDTNKWNYDVGTGNGGWGNGEQQFYTNRLDNVSVHDGHLTITAKKENYSGSQYTSGRITSKNKGDWKYGFVEVRAKLPTGQGTWPAIWMLPSTTTHGYWPNSGEIDIMETTGYNPNKILGTVHTGAYNHLNGTQKGSYTNISNSTSNYNLYQMEWTDTYVKMLVNNKAYFTFYRDVNHPNYMTWPFDEPFHLLLNVAMGGSMGGNISSSFVESCMDVDYVRVYKKNDTSDNVKPSKVNANAISTSNSIHLNWNEASDNQGIKHYEIVVNNKQIVATTSRNYTLTNLNPNTDYQIRVIAVDYNNNYSISDVIQCTTKGENKIPGLIRGYEYSSFNGSGVNVITGSDTGGTQVLNIKGNTTILYDGICTNGGSYSLCIRLAAATRCTMKVEVYASDRLLTQETLSVSSSYGSYKDIALANKVNLPNGNITIQITCEATTEGNAMQINYLNIYE